MSLFYEGEDLEGAEKWLRQVAWRTGGTHCPCCRRHIQVYKRKFTRDMALFLIALVKAARKMPNAWIDVRSFNVRGGDYAKVVHWGLAVLKENSDDPSKKNSGLWKPTRDGIIFACEGSSIYSHMFLYVNEVVGHSQRTVTIREALGKGFDYEELMNS